MVTFNCMGTLLTFASRLYDIGVNRSLGKPLGILNLGRLFLKYFHKFFTNDLTFLFWIGNALEFS